MPSIHARIECGRGRGFPVRWAAMRRQAAVPAAAKVNLHLEILERRGDGYHGIRSLFQLVSLTDAVRVRLEGSRGSCTVEGDTAVSPVENIMVQAAASFRTASGIGDGWALSVRKRIPIGGGLGGGSSDAAAVLRCLQDLYGHPLDGRRLGEIAAALGSDVPFFLGGACGLVEGRGELVTAVTPRTDFRLLAVFPGFPVGTRDAFAWWDAHGGEGGPPATPGGATAGTARHRIVSAYRLESPGSWRFFNSFDPVLMDRFPQLSRIRLALLDLGAVAAGCTGSGSTVIGLFTEDPTAHRALSLFPQSLGRAVVMEPLEEKPSICYNDTLDS
jgi:4-diphosphocytidyl-2-C-methyl-D-erythritol kinase